MNTNKKYNKMFGIIIVITQYKTEMNEGQAVTM